MDLEKPTVLCFSHDYSLLITRQMLLEKIDCAVLCAMGIPELIERLQWKPVDLIVLCQTLTQKECITAKEQLQMYAPHASCLIMYVTLSKWQEEADTERLNSSEGPLEFLRKVRELLHVPVLPVTPAALSY